MNDVLPKAIECRSVLALIQNGSCLSQRSPERSVAHASLLILGLYNKLVKQFGSDFTDRRSVS
jgi:hypothetical protein